MRAASASITCSAWRGCGSCRTAARRATARYPLDDLLRIVALEAARHRAIAIGEDLGTVPAGFRERIAAQGIAGMRVLWFERDADGAFRPPSDWDRDTVAMTSTHDLPTVAGWWRGVDLEWRRGAHAQRDDGPAHGAGDDVGLAAAAHGADGADGDERNAPCLRDDADDAGRDPSPPDPDLAAAAASAETERAAERTALWRALQRAGCAPADQAMPPPAAAGRRSRRLRRAQPVAARDRAARRPARPRRTAEPSGPPCGHPNWLRRLPRAIDALFDAPVRERIAAIERARTARREDA
jgi:4-alpha-glucanotransferase